MTKPIAIESSTGMAVHPKDCALAIGLPLTIDEFTRQWSDRSHEFARYEIGPQTCTNDPKQAWSRMYHRFTSMLRGKIESIGKGLPELGDAPPGKVVWEANLQDVADLLRQYHVVSVVAHTPFHSLNDSDRPAMAAICRAIHAPPDPTDHEVLKALRADAECFACDNDKDLFRCLNARIQDARGFYHCNESASLNRPDLGKPDTMRLTPLSLYRAFPGSFKPPLIIELADGMHDFEAILRAVPEDFRGNLQFLTCSGAYFTPALRACRPHAEDYLSPHQVAWFPERLLVYRIGIELLAYQPMPYRDVVTRAHEIARSL